MLTVILAAIEANSQSEFVMLYVFTIFLDLSMMALAYKFVEGFRK